MESPPPSRVVAPSTTASSHNEFARLLLQYGKSEYRLVRSSSGGTESAFGQAGLKPKWTNPRAIRRSVARPEDVVSDRGLEIGVSTVGRPCCFLCTGGCGQWIHAIPESFPVTFVGCSNRPGQATLGRDCGRACRRGMGGTHLAAGVAVVFVWYTPCRVKEDRIPRPGSMP